MFECDCGEKNCYECSQENFITKEEVINYIYYAFEKLAGRSLSTDGVIKVTDLWHEYGKLKREIENV
jgi:hypothetical protein